MNFKFESPEFEKAKERIAKECNKIATHKITMNQNNIKPQELRATDLRIGNWVIFDLEEVYEQINVRKLGFISQANAKGHSHPFKPIPLSEEVLLRCGFQVYAESCVSKGFSIGINPVTHDYLFTLTWLKDFKTNQLDNFPFYKNGHHVVKYLHQLQNLYYSLVGEELEVRWT